ncbi:MAG: hypothetical protein E6Q78_02430 [Rhodoferax sp.]|nr:MAG: hypothetical protein E6Q78_02430 [Rhodoferax sp.]
MSKCLMKRKSQAGLSLVELMVSLVIGLMVVGAVLIGFMNAKSSNALQGAYADMNESAQIGLTIISRDLLAAGYSQPTGVPTSGTGDQFSRNYSGWPLLGCSKGFIAGKEKATTALTAADCNSSGAIAPAIDIRFEADTVNTVPNGAGVPTDCLGNGLTSAGSYYLASNRYYLATTAGSSRSELHCASNEGSNGQPLVENVEALKFWYGEADAANTRQVVRYVEADTDLTNKVTDWGRVVSVKICLLMRSAEQVRNAEEGALTYLDCDNQTRTNAVGDRYARRAYFTTVTLRNRMSF